MALLIPVAMTVPPMVFAQVGTGTLVRHAAVLPATCNVNEYIAIKDAAGLYWCSALNTWTGVGGTGAITQLTGDVTAGPGTGSIPATVVKVNGVAYSAGPGANTVPVVTGANTVTYEAVPNAALANSAITINGMSVSLGGTRSLALNSADFANEGTTTTLLHGNAAGNPSFGSVLSADLNITTTGCANQFIRSLSSGAVGTCATVANADLANPSITLNGSAISLGGSKTLTLASADFVNQGTTTTVLHGNGAGNPSFGAVVSADLNITTTACTNQFIRSLSSGAVGTCASVANTDLSNSSITVSATSNQTTVSGSPVSLGGTVTIGTVQNINTTSTPQFARLGLGAAAHASTPLLLSGSGQMVNGSGATTNNQYQEFTSTGGDMILGLESSAGGSILASGLAYATVLETVGSTALQLGTGNTARVTVSSGGNVGINGTAPVSLLSVNGNGATGYTFYVNSGTSGLAGRVYMPGVSAAAAATAADACFQATGELVNDTALCVVSARRFKNTIERSTVGLDFVKRLQPVSYFLNDSPERGQQFGFVAEDVEAIDKRFVTYQADGQIRSVLYLEMIPVLTTSIQELEARVRMLEGR